MAYRVLLTEDAANDLESLYDFIAEHDSLVSASHVLDQLDETLSRLADFPERGNYPKELSALGIHDYRGVFFKPYQIVYRVIEQSVYVDLIVDRRGDLQILLQRRLLCTS